MDDKMEKKYEFVERFLHLLRKKLEDNLPKEGTLEEMMNEIEKIVDKIFK